MFGHVTRQPHLQVLLELRQRLNLRPLLVCNVVQLLCIPSVVFCDSRRVLMYVLDVQECLVKHEVDVS